jgi:hypothetical protein
VSRHRPCSRRRAARGGLLCTANKLFSDAWAWSRASSNSAPGSVLCQYSSGNRNCASTASNKTRGLPEHSRRKGTRTRTSARRPKPRPTQQLLVRRSSLQSLAACRWTPQLRLMTS